MSGANSAQTYVGLSTLYTVTISAPSSNAPPSDGFVDPTRIEYYLDDLANPPASFTLAASQAKRRANLRYAFIIAQLGLMANIYVEEFVATNADASTAPSAVTFNIEVERGDGSLATHDETNPPAVLLGVDALVRCIARGMMENQTLEIDVFDPTKTTTTGPYGSTPAVRFGTRIMPLVVGPLATNLAAAQATITIISVPQGTFPTDDDVVNPANGFS